MTDEQRIKVDWTHDSLHRFFDRKGLTGQGEEDEAIGRLLAGAALHLLGDHDCPVGYVIAAIAEHLNTEAFATSNT